MRLRGKVLLWTLGGRVALPGLLALSIPIDGVLGRGRVASLTSIEAIRAGGPQGEAWAELPGFLSNALQN